MEDAEIFWRNIKKKNKIRYDKIAVSNDVYLIKLTEEVISR
jgi:hypothetical protein